MVVPLAARYAAAAVGVLLVATSAGSVVGTLIVPRSVSSWLTGFVDKLVDAGYRLATKRTFDLHRRDRILATQAATLLICQLIGWLLLFFLGFSLMFWPLIHSGITDAFRTAGPALWEIGTDRARGGLQSAIVDVASLFGLITITLQIAYLPSLYSAFNRRETDVALLAARAGIPSWGPELLARTHYALGTGVSSVNTLPDLYENWERWAADIAESHTTYLPLVRFRSPRGGSSWVTGLLAVLDSAAMILAVSPGQTSIVQARLCLRSGFTCFRLIARAMGYDVPDEPDPTVGISLTYEDFLDAIERLRNVDFPIERDPAEAWPDFVGWRVTYEQPAYDIAYALDVVPAMWSGPRRHGDAPIRPKRPPEGRPPPNGGYRNPTPLGSGPPGQPSRRFRR
jgi:hypothetical protein